jgi:acetyl esterase/lipase
MVKTIAYATPNGESLEADLYLPEPSGTPRPVVMCAHGGGWKGGARRTYRFIGPWLAANGYLVMSIDYRLLRGAENRYPAAVDDVRAALGYVRAHASDLNADVARIALMGDSAGGHLIALAGLTAAGAVKAIVPVFGVYDLAAQWESDLLSRPHDNICENFLGVPLTQDRKLYFDASPISHAVTANNALSVLLAWGTNDDIVVPAQSERFLLALKQANFYVRTVVQAAPHYWMSDPLDDPGSYSGFFAPRLLRFLNERVAV